MNRRAKRLQAGKSHHHSAIWFFNSYFYSSFFRRRKKLEKKLTRCLLINAKMWKMGRSNPRKIFTFSIHNPTLDYMSVHASWWGFFVIGLNWWRISVLEISRRLCVGSAAHDWTSRRPQFFRNVNIPRIIDSVILKYRTELSISELYLAFAGRSMKYEAKVFFYYKNITHHPAITLLEASRVAQNEEERKNGCENWCRKKFWWGY